MAAGEDDEDAAGGIQATEAALSNSHSRDNPTWGRWTVAKGIIEGIGGMIGSGFNELALDEILFWRMVSVYHFDPGCHICMYCFVGEGAAVFCRLLDTIASKVKSIRRLLPLEPTSSYAKLR